MHIIVSDAKERRRKTEKVPWSAEETKALLRQLGHFVKLRRVPNKTNCEDCKMREPALTNRTWKNIKYSVHSRIQAAQRQDRLTRK